MVINPSCTTILEWESSSAEKGRLEGFSINHLDDGWYRIEVEEEGSLEEALASLVDKRPITTLEIEGGEWTPHVEQWLARLEVQRLLLAKTRGTNITLIRTIDSIEELCLGLEGGFLSLRTEENRVAATLEECSPQAAIAALSLLQKSFPDLSALHCEKCKLTKYAGKKILEFPQLHCLALTECQASISGELAQWQKITALYCTSMSLSLAQKLKENLPQTELIVQAAKWKDLLKQRIASTPPSIATQTPHTIWSSIANHKGGILGGIGAIAFGISGHPAAVQMWEHISTLVSNIGIPIVGWLADANDDSWLRTIDRSLKGGFGSPYERFDAGSQYVYRYWRDGYRNPTCDWLQEQANIGEVCREGLLEAAIAVAVSVGAITLFFHYRGSGKTFTLDIG
jgi:hypothetical protein